MELALLFLTFTASGAAGLIYESIWSRYLGLFVGHAAYAQVLVLTIFLGGMSLGSFLVGRRAARLRAPLLGYAAVELASGLIGLAFHAIFGRVTGWAYDAVFPAVGAGAGLTAVKWGLAGALILPQSILLGMTFPLMSGGLLRLRPVRPGRTLALLYFTNSLGGAGGVLLAGFVTLARGGLPGTLATAAWINVAAALVVGLVGARRIRSGAAASGAGAFDSAASGAAVSGAREVDSAASGTVASDAAAHEATAAIAPALALPRLRRLLLAVSFGTAVASFVYEIGWIRMLSLVLGSATHAFELMLSAFILGLAFGALYVHRRVDGFRSPVGALGAVQILMGAAALATLPLYQQSFAWTARLLGAVQPNDGGYALFTTARYGFCLAVMFPATFCAGMTLPLITRTLMAAGRGEAAVGYVYASNTLGSIVGAALAGLVLMPLVGVKLLLVAGGVLDMAIGVALLRAAEGRRIVWAAAGAAAAIAAFTTFGVRFDRALLSSGVYRFGTLPEPGERDVVYYRDGRTTSIAVTHNTRARLTSIITNGKPDASLEDHWLPQRGVSSPGRMPIGGDLSTQILLPLIAQAHRPNAATIAVVGHGSGLSAHFLLASPFAKELVTIEIEPAMVEGSRAFYPANRRVFDDPRSRVVIEDARSFFATDPRRFDIILAEPSNPWVSGVASLFSREFYARLRRSLDERGLLAQWLHLYEIDDTLVLSVLAAVDESFPAYEMFLTSDADLLILASPSAVPTPDWSLLSAPHLAQDLRYLVIPGGRQLETTRLGGRLAFGALLEGWRRRNVVNSDFFPVLDLGAESARFRHARPHGFAALTEARFDLLAPFDARTPNPAASFGTETTPFVPGLPRMRGLALAAALRAGRAGSPPASDVAALGVAFPVARQHVWAFEKVLASASAPPDWRLWLEECSQVETLLHKGTAGIADEGFYGAVASYLDRVSAPTPVRDAVTFMHGLAAWDFAEVSAASDRLVPDALGRDTSTWVPIDALLEGTVIAKLRTGDLKGAQKAIMTLAPRSARTRDDVRAKLLASFVSSATARSAHAARTARTK